MSLAVAVAVAVGLFRALSAEAVARPGVAGQVACWKSPAGSEQDAAGRAGDAYVRAHRPGEQQHDLR